MFVRVCACVFVCAYLCVCVCVHDDHDRQFWLITGACAQGYTGPDGQGAKKPYASASEPLYLVPTQRYTYWTPPWLHASKYGKIESVSVSE